MYGETDVQSGLHILGTFDADRRLVSSRTPELAPSRTSPSDRGDLGCSDFNGRAKAQEALDKDCHGKACEYLPRAPRFNPKAKTGSQEERTTDDILPLGQQQECSRTRRTLLHNGTHALTAEVSGCEDGRLLDSHMSRRVTVYDPPVSGCENGAEHDLPLLSVTRVEPA